MSAHTPGPWNVVGIRRVFADAPNYFALATIADPSPDFRHQGFTASEIRNANAAMIAAAPSLYEAALKAQCACSIKERDSGHLVDCWMPEMLAAITKAEGR